MGHAGELFAQRLGQIAHLGKLAGPTLVDPTKQLGGAKALFSESFAEPGERIQIES